GVTVQPVTTQDSTTAVDTSNSSETAQSGSFNIQNKSWRIAIEARQVIYAGGQVRSAIKIAHFEKDNTYFSLIETINTVVDAVRKQFYEVLLNRALITVQEESVKLLQSELENQRSRFEAGTVPRFNV